MICDRVCNQEENEFSNTELSRKKPKFDQEHDKQ